MCLSVYVSISLSFLSASFYLSIRLSTHLICLPIYLVYRELPTKVEFEDATNLNNEAVQNCKLKMKMSKSAPTLRCF
jgi:hypothetical protein